MSKVNLTIEKVILVALVKAVNEQSNFLNKEFKFRQKQEFINWQNAGIRIIKELENNPAIAHTLNVITEDVENSIHKTRKELNLIYNEANKN